MELIIQLEHILAVVVALGAIIGWLASKVAKAQKLEDRIIALEEEKSGSKETKDRIWSSLERINNRLHNMELKMTTDHGELSKRLAVLEASGCNPVRREESE